MSQVKHRPEPRALGRGGWQFGLVVVVAGQEAHLKYKKARLKHGSIGRVSIGFERERVEKNKKAQ